MRVDRTTTRPLGDTTWALSKLPIFIVGDLSPTDGTFTWMVKTRTEMLSLLTKSTRSRAGARGQSAAFADPQTEARA